MGLADFVTACTPPDGCSLCRFKAQVEAEDQAYARDERAFLARHKAFVQSLKRWVKTQSPDIKAKMMAELTKGEREWPTVSPQKRLTGWKGWNRPSEKS